MGIHLSDQVENIVGEGEIAHYKQLLLFPQCFQKLSSVDVSKLYLWSKELRLLKGLEKEKMLVAKFFSLRKIFLHFQK